MAKRGKFRSGADSSAYISELRLTNLEKLDLEALRSMTSGLPKIRRALRCLAALAEMQA